MATLPRNRTCISTETTTTHSQPHNKCAVYYSARMPPPPPATNDNAPLLPDASYNPMTKIPGV